MARAKVKIHSAGARAILKSEPVRRYLYDQLAPAESAAKSSAPRESGAYAASIHREADIGHSRARGLLVADVSYALVVEANTGTLAHALDAVRGG